MKKPHSTKSKRRIITINEWAKYLEVSRHTARQRIRQYTSHGGEYDARDIYSILDFFKWLFKRGT